MWTAKTYGQKERLGVGRQTLEHRHAAPRNHAVGSLLVRRVQHRPADAVLHRTVVILGANHGRFRRMLARLSNPLVPTRRVFELIARVKDLADVSGVITLLAEILRQEHGFLAQVRTGRRF